jgi:peptidyl-prolyl cis-trans isomerase D
MISNFRDFSKSKWAVGLFVLIMLSFVVVGARMDVFANMGPKNVISAGDRSMDQASFRSAMDRVRNNLQEQAGRPVTIEDLAAENIHLRFLESQTQQLGFLAWAWDAGIRPGKALVLKQIRGIPQFFNQVTGQFDQAQYEQALATQNITPAEVEQDFRDRYAVEHFQASIAAGARLPRIYGALLAGQMLQTRDGRWFTVTQAMAGAAPAPTDAQLTAYLTQNADSLRRPEFRMVSVVVFTPSPEQLNAAVTDEAIQARFDFRRAALSQPEKRSFVTLTAPTRAVADRVAAALRAGQSVEAVGQANNIRPTDYPDTPQSALGDPAVGAAVFGLTAGQVSDPIQGRVGFTVAQLRAITPGRAATLPEVREAIVEELRQEAARGQTYEKVEQYERAREQGRNLAQAAQQVGARIVQLPPFTQDGRLPDGQEMNAPPQLLSTAYSLAKGGESEVVDGGNGQYFVIRVDDVRPAALPALADVRGPLAQRWTAQENARRLTARAEALAARVRGGEDIAAVAASVGASLTTRTGVQQNQQVQTELGQGLIQGLFGQSRGQVFSQPQSANSFVIGRVDAVRAAVPALAAPVAEQVRPRITQEVVQAMIEQSLNAGAARVKATNDPALARQALGLPEAPATSAPVAAK